jgi:regulator of protease activity HflC (stomatin/prohibitin superfamily)
MAEESIGVKVSEHESTPIRTLAIGLIGFIALLILISIFSPTLAKTIISNIPYIVLISIVIYSFTKVFVIKYGQTERGIIYRFGKFNRVAGPGWSIVIPFFEKEFSKVDVRTRTEVINEASAVTKDDIPLNFDVSFFYSIADPKKAVLQVTALEDTLKTFLRGIVRDGVGNFTMRDVFYNMSEIASTMKERATPMTEQWGITINGIEILHVKLPDAVMNALYQPVTEEQKAIAARFQAEAIRVTTEVLGDAAERLNPNALTYLYLKALEKVASAENSKIVLPMSFPTIMNSLTAGLGLGMGLEGIDQQKVIEQIAQKISGK